MAMALPRVWQPASHLPALLSEHSIRIVSWNLLAQKYSGFHAYCPPQHLAWASRWPRIQQQLGRLNADLLCLQEVEQTVFQDQLQPWAAGAGYDSLFVPRASLPGSPPGPDEGVSLHWRASQFAALATESVRFADAAASALPAACLQAGAASSGGSSSSGGGDGGSSSGSSGSSKGEAAFLQTLLGRSEGCLLALLQHLPSRQRVCVCSTHLFWNPAHPDVKVAQAAILCAAIAAFLQRQQGQPPPPGLQAAAGTPVLLAGDLNSVPEKWASDQWDTVPADGCLTSGVVELLRSGRLGPSHADHPARRSCAGAGRSALARHTFTAAGLRLASTAVTACGREPALTTRTGSFEGTLDYIWASQGDGLCVSATLAQPYPQPSHPSQPVPASAWPPCPNEAEPSDHLPVGAELRLAEHSPAAAVDEVMSWRE